MTFVNFKCRTFFLVNDSSTWTRSPAPVQPLCILSISETLCGWSFVTPCGVLSLGVNGGPDQQKCWCVQFLKPNHWFKWTETTMWPVSCEPGRHRFSFHIYLVAGTCQVGRFQKSQNYMRVNSPYLFITPKRHETHQQVERTKIMTLCHFLIDPRIFRNNLYSSRICSLETKKNPEKWWCEDDSFLLKFKDGPFLGDMLIFGGVFRGEMSKISSSIFRHKPLA